MTARTITTTVISIMTDNKDDEYGNNYDTLDHGEEYYGIDPLSVVPLRSSVLLFA